ncbi:MAG: hypothetical protein ICV69_08390 [Thermoleophilaceae bacterium]|nr:hypothetical protein [Thermoleophilaceae bacterium]
MAHHRDPYERRPAEQPREPHTEASQPGEKLQLDCLYVGRLSGTEGTVWQYPAIDVASAYARASSGNRGAPPERATPRAAPPRQFGDAVERLGARRRSIKVGRPNSSGRIERLQLSILEECGAAPWPAA